MLRRDIVIFLVIFEEGFWNFGVVSKSWGLGDRERRGGSGLKRWKGKGGSFYVHPC